MRNSDAKTCPTSDPPAVPEVTSCGMISSSFVQVTVSPTATWIVAGPYAKSLIDTVESAEAAPGQNTRQVAATTSNTPIPRFNDVSTPGGLPWYASLDASL